MKKLVMLLVLLSGCMYLKGMSPCNDCAKEVQIRFMVRRYAGFRTGSSMLWPKSSHIAIVDNPTNKEISVNLTCNNTAYSSVKVPAYTSQSFLLGHADATCSATVTD